MTTTSGAQSTLPLELFKLAFPGIGALWLFYGVTLLGLLKQLQDPGGMLEWPRLARLAILIAVGAFLWVNYFALQTAHTIVLSSAADAGLPLAVHADKLKLLLGGHAVIDVAVFATTGLVLFMRRSKTSS